MRSAMQMGLDPDKLDEEDILRFERAIRKTTTSDPAKLKLALEREGVDLPALINKMRGPQAPKKSVRVGRNAKCPCGSGAKFKKCCG